VGQGSAGRYKVYSLLIKLLWYSKGEEMIQIGCLARYFIKFEDEVAFNSNLNTDLFTTFAHKNMRRIITHYG